MSKMLTTRDEFVEYAGALAGFPERLESDADDIPF